MSGEKSKKQGVQASTGAKASSAKEPLTETKTVKETKADKGAQSKKKTTRKKVSGGGVSNNTAANSSKRTKRATKASPAKETAGTNGRPGSEPTPVHATVQSDNGRSGSGLVWLAIAASLLAMGASAYSIYHSTLSQGLNKANTISLDQRVAFLSAEQKGLLSSVSTLEQKSAGANETQQARINALQQAQSALQTSIAGIELVSKASTEDIKASLGKNVARWKLDEVHSLLSRVNQYYQLTGDKTRAKAGLALANATLATIDNPHLGPVKVALAEDLLRIESDANVDVEAINSRLQALSALIPEMKLLGETLKVANTSESAPNTAEQADSGFLQAGKSLLDDLSGLVKYKNLDAPLRPSLDGAERFVLYELLQLKIQTAMAALMRQNNDVYQSQLKAAEDEIRAYFDLEQAHTRTVLDELKALGSQDVSLNIEPVAGGLSGLNEVMILEQ